MDLTVDDVQVPGVVGRCDRHDPALQPVERPAVDLHQLTGRQRIGGIEVLQVLQHEARGVAHAAVGIGNLAEDVLRERHLLPEVRVGEPHAQHVGAVLLIDLSRADDVALALREFRAGLIYEEAVADDSPVGCRVSEGHRDPQGGLEPALILVVALEVEVGGE